MPGSVVIYEDPFTTSSTKATPNKVQKIGRWNIATQLVFIFTENVIFIIVMIEFGIIFTRWGP